MLSLVAAITASSLALAPVVVPQKPTPFFSWEFIPTAFHGANKSGTYNDDAVALLAEHQMVTIEKWYTPCASQGPAQGPPSCAVESKIENVLGQVKAKNKNVTGIMYLNSMLDFQFYTLHGLLEAAEAKGQHSYLRDNTGAVISLCNDGDVYCNITTFDWTQPHVRALWLEAITNATATGHVDGIFADHSAQEHIQIGAGTNGQKPNQLCNGEGKGRHCYNFSATFTEEFNSWHLYMTNKSQDMLSKSTGGPVICGPEAMYGTDGCSFDAIRGFQKSGRQVCQATVHGAPNRNCLAAFLAAANQYTYLLNMAGAPIDFPERRYPLGRPHGPAVESPQGIFTRKFASGTVVVWDNVRHAGNVTWGGGQPPPPGPPPPAPPQPAPPAVCGTMLANTGAGEADIGSRHAASAAACCSQCEADPLCAIWAWHAEQPGDLCHRHTAKATKSPNRPGCFAGWMNRTRSI